MGNLGWLFYKKYYQNLSDDDFRLLLKENQTENEKKSLTTKLQDNINELFKPIEKVVSQELGNIHFKATTTYPGLLLGSGYNHQLSIKEELILGFDFDYTTGLPIIRGSSIKGVLRSAFKHWEYIAENTNLKTKEEIKQLESEIFENNDIFFDATIISSGKILADDYLAPHGDNPLKNPTPLRFIKVAPNITFRFDFFLSDGIISKQTKSKLFQNILEDLGVGAKTNVGYGKFESFSPFKTQEEENQEKKELELKKEQERLQREKELEDLRKVRDQKAQGITQLESCKNIKEAMKILNDSLGKKTKPTPEQQTIIEQFWKKHSKKASKSEVKFFKKFGL